MTISRFGRRRFGRSAFAATIATLAAGALNPLRAADYYRPPDLLAGTVAPPIVYIPETGHHMEGPFARFWHNLGGAAVLGYPITETIIEDGLRTQYFENVRLRWVRDGSIEGAIWVSPLGAKLQPTADLSEARPIDAVFATYYQDHFGATLLGQPISPRYREGVRSIQWFENGRLEARGGNDGHWDVQLSPLGREFAGVTGAPTTPVLPEEMAINPNPRNFTRWFEGNLTRQTLTFWEAGQVVHETYMSSGLLRPTPVGEFVIYRRVENEHMVSDAPPGAPGYYDLYGVLFTQYFSRWFDALHYAYWHNDFGKPKSHGCLNLRLGDSRLAWEFGGVGTTVETHP